MLAYPPMKRPRVLAALALLAAFLAPHFAAAEGATATGAFSVTLEPGGAG